MIIIEEEQVDISVICKPVFVEKVFTETGETSLVLQKVKLLFIESNTTYLVGCFQRN